MPLRALCVALALSYVSAVDATIIFTLGNNPQPGEENILLTGGNTGTSVVGTTNQTDLDVTFTSTQTLVVPAAGTSITGDGTPLTNIHIALTDGGASSDYILDPVILSTGCTSCGGFATITVESLLNGSPEGTSFFTYQLGNGNNIVTVTTADGESIASISIAAPQGFSSLSLPRISGPYTGTSSVPEPATLALLGVAIASFGFARRRKLN